jgi:hypothetical protein
MITLKDAESALDFLKSTDAELGRKKALYKGLDEQKKTILAFCVEDSPGKSATERKDLGPKHPDYIGHLKKIMEAHQDYEILNNQRNSAAMQIEMWRSINSAQKLGNI